MNKFATLLLCSIVIFASAFTQEDHNTISAEQVTATPPVVIMVDVNVMKQFVPAQFYSFLSSPADGCGTDAAGHCYCCYSGWCYRC